MRYSVTAVLLATALGAPAAMANVIFPFGKQYNSWDNSSTTYFSQTNVYVDTTPIQKGLEAVAESIQENETDEYIRRIKARYPDLREYGTTIGLNPDRAESTQFIRKYGKAAYEHEIEARLTDLQENLVIAADLARAARGEPALKSASELAARQESLYPFDAKGLMSLIHDIRRGTPFDVRTLFDKHAAALLEKAGLSGQADKIVARLRAAIWAETQNLAEITYDNVGTSANAIVAAAAEWHDAVAKGLNLSPINAHFESPAQTVCDSLAAAAIKDATDEYQARSVEFNLAFEKEVAAKQLAAVYNSYYSSLTANEGSALRQDVERNKQYSALFKYRLRTVVAELGFQDLLDVKSPGDKDIFEYLQVCSKGDLVCINVAPASDWGDREVTTPESILNHAAPYVNEQGFVDQALAKRLDEESCRPRNWVSLVGEHHLPAQATLDTTTTAGDVDLKTVSVSTIDDDGHVERTTVLPPHAINIENVKGD